jgi:hypothetical protein
LSWKKLGLVYCPERSQRHPKLLTHASNPLAVHLEGDVYRVFYSGRDSRSRSSVGAIDLDISTLKILRDFNEPFFEHGPANSYYADGVSVGCTYRVKNKQFMLFMGWQSPKSAQWRGDIGRLEVSKNLRLSLPDNLPFMGSDSADPLSLSYPWVCRLKNDGYRMWYGSTIAWDGGNGEMIHVIKSAFSKDGHFWTREGLAIPFQLGNAQAFSRPSVLENEDGSFEMWFSYRGAGGGKYRIGYATSPDGIAWQNENLLAGIDVSKEGWDSEMIEYPFVFEHKNFRYMLYNGNGYGLTGFGIAARAI